MPAPTTSANGTAGTNGHRLPSPLDAGRAYLRAGVSVIPIGEGKTPACNLLPRVPNECGELKATWNPFRERLATADDAHRWWGGPKPAGIGIVCGSVSGGLEVIDVDRRELVEAFKAVAEAAIPGLIARVTQHSTPAGWHFAYRCETIDGNAKLAELADDDPGVAEKTAKQTLIETRGEGGYIVAPGSPGWVHPSGKTYEHVAGPPITDAPTIAPEERDILFAAAQSFNRKVEHVEAPAGPPPARPQANPADIRPGDDFEARADWTEILGGNGWTLSHTSGAVGYWKRPGKLERGCSATLGHCKDKQTGAPLLHVFSSNAAPLQSGKTYGKFPAYVHLQHNGDWSAAAKALYQRGFGTRREKPKAPSAPRVQREPGDNDPHGTDDAPDPLDFKPFPLNSLPIPLREYVITHSEAMGCDPSMVAVPLLSGAAGAIGNSRALAVKRGHVEPAVFWGMTIAKSGTLKTPAGQIALAPLQKIQERAFADHETAMAEYAEKLAAHERQQTKGKRKDPCEVELKMPIHPVCPRCVYGNTTMEALVTGLEQNPRGVLSLHDELAGWFAAMDAYRKGRGGDGAAWLSFHGAGTVINDRKTGDKRITFIRRAAVSLFGTIQPGTLARHMADGAHLETGMLARFGLAMPPTPPELWRDYEPDAAVEAETDAVFRKLVSLEMVPDDEGKLAPVYLGMTGEAKREWIEFHNRHAVEVAGIDDDAESAAWSKLKGYAARLALIHHVVTQVATGRDDRAPVSVESIRVGIALSAWFKGEARRVYSLLSKDGNGNPASRAKTLEDVIREEGGTINVRSFLKNHQRFGPTATLRGKLEIWVSDGRGEWIDDAPGPSGGRPAGVFRLRLGEGFAGNAG